MTGWCSRFLLTVTYETCHIPSFCPYRNQKAPNHQNGSIHLTSHRLIYVDSVHPRRQSLAFALSDVRQSEYYAGFLTSSPKITLSLSSPIHPSKSADVGPGAGEAASSAAGSGDTSSTRWECEICGNKNIDTGLAPKLICQLCGVPRSSKSSAVGISGLSKISASTPALSQSLPVSTSPSVLHPPSAPPIEHDDDDNGIACPACTFINHPSLRNCELCNTALPKRTRIPNKSAPSSRPPSPTLEDQTPTGGDALIKVSFRGGGDRAFHAALKRVLIAKAWAVDVPTAKAPPAGGSKSGIRTSFTESPLTYPILIHSTHTDGIVETLRSETTTKKTYMESSLQDLESLMSQANAMVQQAKALGLSLAQAQSQPYSNVQLPEEAQFIISTSMARLGLIPDAVTPDMIKDEERYTEELAKELGGFLTGTIGAGGGKGKRGMMDDRGLVGLDEVWGGWNRARGVGMSTRLYNDIIVLSCLQPLFRPRLSCRYYPDCPPTQAL